MKMFRKSLCKNFPISQPTRSPQSPTRSEQIQPNQSKILSSWSHWSITGKSKVTTQEKHSNDRRIHPTKLHMKPIKQSKSSVNPPSTSIMTNKTHTWNPSNAHAVHQATITSPLPPSTNANHTQNPSTQKSSTHHIHSNPTHQKQLRHNLTSKNSTWKS